MANSIPSQQAGTLFREKPSLEVSFEIPKSPISMGDIGGGLKDLLGEIAGTNKTTSETQPSMLSGEKKPFPSTGSIEGFQKPKINPEVVAANIQRFQAEEHRIKQTEAVQTQREEIRLDVAGTPIEDRNKALNISKSYKGKLSYTNMVNFREAKKSQQVGQPSMLGEKMTLAAPAKGLSKGPGKGTKFDAEGGGTTSGKSRVG